MIRCGGWKWKEGETQVAVGFRYGGDTSRGGKGGVGEKGDTWRGGAAHGRQIAGRRRIQCRRWEMCKCR
ncbi:hypothetical protein Csa_020053 [Cucumis sativus]|uniref:Uncharacterized protein n=1 Tax=Cucumis sativus TaxID=3659 RepID=A0A0A0LUZ7_CUCSA|nr:hypothetical protein Csa_020053 [Cucumis sativus]